MQLSQQAEITSLAAQLGVLRPRDVESKGIPREYLLRLLRRGVLVRSGRGLYRLADAPVTEHHSLVEVAKRTPDATICLLSALVFHDLTTQLPPAVWIALPAGRRAPRLDTVQIRVVRFTGKALTEGREEHKLEGVPVQIYCAAKTVADCFKFRHKIGLDVAMEALRTCLHKRGATVRDIQHYAEICRVARVMRPYLEAIS